MTTLLFLHGWGFDARLWDGVRAALPGVAAVAWDRGYFRPAEEPAVAGPVVAVGHSLGAMLLAARLPVEVPLVAINGFDRFAGEGAVPRRVIDRMRLRFGETPGAVLNDFRTRCGASAAEMHDPAMLAADLDRLEMMAVPRDDRRVLVLHGAADPILPAAMRAATFAGAARETNPAAGHLLPLTHPEWCAERIAGLLSTHRAPPPCADIMPDHPASPQDGAAAATSTVGARIPIRSSPWPAPALEPGSARLGAGVSTRCPPR